MIPWIKLQHVWYEKSHNLSAILKLKTVKSPQVRFRHATARQCCHLRRSKIECEQKKWGTKTTIKLRELKEQTTISSRSVVVGSAWQRGRSRTYQVQYNTTEMKKNNMTQTQCIISRTVRGTHSLFLLLNDKANRVAKITGLGVHLLSGWVCKSYVTRRRE